MKYQLIEQLINLKTKFNDEIQYNYEILLETYDKQKSLELILNDLIKILEGKIYTSETGVNEFVNHITGPNFEDVSKILTLHKDLGLIGKKLVLNYLRNIEELK